jgi:hypothetical protein
MRTTYPSLESEYIPGRRQVNRTEINPQAILIQPILLWGLVVVLSVAKSRGHAMAWSPSLYLRHGKSRLRPAVDLLTYTVSSIQDPHEVKRVLDLGCG